MPKNAEVALELGNGVENEVWKFMLEKAYTAQTDLYFFICKILLLRNLYSQHGAQTYNPKI